MPKPGRSWPRGWPLALLCAGALLTACDALFVPPAIETEGATSREEAPPAPEPVAREAMAQPRPVVIDPETLLGLESAALADLLGAPSYVREDRPALIWQYRGESCTLDVFLYSDGEGEGAPYRVTYYDLRERSAARTDHADCLAARARES